MVGMYFEKRRPLANALSSAGECIFTFILTPLFQLLIDSFSWRGALLILGALQLNLCVCGMLLRPLPTPRQIKAEEGGSESLPKGAAPEESVRLSEVSDEDVCKGSGDDGKTAGTELRTKVLRYVDYTLITNAKFMVYSTFGVFAALGFFAPALFLVPYARSNGIEEYEAAALISISAVMDLIGRVFFGWLANLRLVPTVGETIKYAHRCSSIINTLCNLSVNPSKTFAEFIFMHQSDKEPRGSSFQSVPFKILWLNSIVI